MNDCPYHLFIVTPVRFSLPTIHPSVRRRANSLRQHSKKAFFHSGIKFAGSLETARNVTLPIIPWSPRQAGSLMARLENAAPSSSCHCKLSREPWIIRPFCLRQHYRGAASRGNLRQVLLGYFFPPWGWITRSRVLSETYCMIQNSDWVIENVWWLAGYNLNPQKVIFP